MSKLPVNFSTKDHKGRMGNFDPIPNGEYVGRLKENERVPTKANLEKNEGNKVAIKNGQHRYKLTWEITQGEYKGRLIFGGLNLEHDDEKTVERAYDELATIYDAYGKVSVDDLDDLKGEIILKIGLGKASPEYPANNVVKDYLPMKGVKKPTLGNKSKDEDEEEDEAPKKPTFGATKPKVSFGKNK